MVAYAQGAADLCAAYGLASVMHEFGDVSGAATIAVCARAALTVRCRARTFFGAPAAGALACLRARAQPLAAPHVSRPCGAAARRPPLVTRAAQEVGRC